MASVSEYSCPLKKALELNTSMLLYCVIFSFPTREKVDKRFIDACVYVKDRMEEVSSPDKEMVRVTFHCFR